MLTEVDDKNLITITPQWMEEKFDEMNKLLFNGILRKCKFSLFTTGKGSRGHILGWFTFHKEPNVIFKRVKYPTIGAQAYIKQEDYIFPTDIDDFVYYLNPEIKLNGNYNWTEKAALSTLVHEMCHYYVSKEGFWPSRPHGAEFMRVAQMVSAKSNDFFSVQRVAMAEQMEQMDFTDEFKEFNNKRAAKGVHVIKFQFSKPETSSRTHNAYIYGYVIPTSTKVQEYIDYIKREKFFAWAVDCVTTDGTVKKYHATSSVGAYYYAKSLDAITPDVKFDSETIIKDNFTDVERIVAESIKKVINEISPIDTFSDKELVAAAKQKGFNYIGYHSHEYPITSFRERNETGIHFGSLQAANDRAADTGEDRETTPYFLKIQKPLYIEKDFDWEGNHLYDWQLDGSDVEDWTPWEDELCPESWLYEHGFNIFVNRKDGKDGMRSLKDIISDKGYDAIIYKNEIEDKGNYSVAMFNPKNIKEAAKTYYKNGTPIPLEKRFNTNVNDVRF